MSLALLSISQIHPLHTGVFGQYLRVEPTLDTVVARFEGEDVTVELKTEYSSSVSVAQSDIGWIKVCSVVGPGAIASAVKTTDQGLQFI